MSACVRVEIGAGKAGNSEGIDGQRQGDGHVHPLLCIDCGVEGVTYTE